MIGLCPTKGDEIFLEIEIKLQEANRLCQLMGYRPTIYPHMMTSKMCKGVYYLNLEPTVGRIVGIVDEYKIKTWNIKSSEGKNR